MERAELERHLALALGHLLERDAYLLEDDASEWSVAHRLAVYLEQQLPDWDVDCEYNRQGSGGAVKKRAAGDVVRPDIIVHRRRQLAKAQNLLVVELKKSDAESDLGKAAEYTATPQRDRLFQYQYGAVVTLGSGPSVEWFENGAIRG